jgi:hypothetical protein
MCVRIERLFLLATRQNRVGKRTGDSMSGKQTLIAISAAVALGSVGAASVAQAGNQGEDRGGFVMPGSMDGVNPVYHPEWFGKGANAGNAGPAGNAFDYAAPRVQKRRPAHERTQER